MSIWSVLSSESKILIWKTFIPDVKVAIVAQNCSLLSILVIASVLRREENPYLSGYSPVWLPYQFCAPLYTEERQQHHFNGYRESESYGNWLATISWWVVWGINLYILLPAKRRLSTGVVSPSVCLCVCVSVIKFICKSVLMLKSNDDICYGSQCCLQQVQAHVRLFS